MIWALSSTPLVECAVVSCSERKEALTDLVSVLTAKKEYPRRCSSLINSTGDGFKPLHFAAVLNFKIFDPSMLQSRNYLFLKKVLVIIIVLFSICYDVTECEVMIVHWKLYFVIGRMMVSAIIWNIRFGVLLKHHSVVTCRQFTRMVSTLQLDGIQKNSTSVSRNPIHVLCRWSSFPLNISLHIMGILQWWSSGGSSWVSVFFRAVKRCLFQCCYYLFSWCFVCDEQTLTLKYYRPSFDVNFRLDYGDCFHKDVRLNWVLFHFLIQMAQNVTECHIEA